MKTPTLLAVVLLAGTAAHAVATGPSPPACADTPFAQWPVALMTNMQYSITDFGAGACSEAVKVLGKGGWMGLPRIACDTDLTAGLGKADPSGGMIGFGAWLQRNDNIPPGRKGLQRMLKMTGTLADLCPATCNACPAGDNHGPCPTALKAKFGCDPDDLECVCENSGGILGWVRHEAPAGTCTALNVVTAGSWNAMCADTIPSPTSFTLTDAKGRTKGEVVFGAGAGAASDAKVPADLTPKEKLVPVTKRAWFAPVVAVAAVAVVVALAAAFVRWGVHGATAQAAEGNNPVADLDDAAEWGAPVHNKGNKAPGAPIVVIANVV